MGEQDILIKDTNKLVDFHAGVWDLISEYSEDLSVADMVYILEETKYKIMRDMFDSQEEE